MATLCWNTARVFTFPPLETKGTLWRAKDPYVWSVPPPLDDDGWSLRLKPRSPTSLSIPLKVAVSSFKDASQDVLQGESQSPTHLFIGLVSVEDTSVCVGVCAERTQENGWAFKAATLECPTWVFSHDNACPFPALSSDTDSEDWADGAEDDGGDGAETDSDACLDNSATCDEFTDGSEDAWNDG